MINFEKSSSLRTVVEQFSIPDFVACWKRTTCLTAVCRDKLMVKQCGRMVHGGQGTLTANIGIFAGLANSDLCSGCESESESESDSEFAYEVCSQA